MYRNLIEETEKYLKNQKMEYPEVDVDFPVEPYPGLAEHLYRYMEETYCVTISEEYKEGRTTIRDIAYLTEEELFLAAGCVEVYLLLQTCPMLMKAMIPAGLMEWLLDNMKNTDYRWKEVSHLNVEKFLLLSPDQMADFDDYRMLGMTSGILQEIMDTYWNQEEFGYLFGEFPPLSFDEVRAVIDKADRNSWPFRQELPLLARYPATILLHMEEKKEPLWQLVIDKSEREYLVLKHRDSYQYRDRVYLLVRPGTTVEVFENKEKIQFFDYICDEDGNPTGIHCLIKNESDPREEAFEIKELYPGKEVNIRYTTDTLRQYSCDRRYRIQEGKIL